VQYAMLSGTLNMVDVKISYDLQNKFSCTKQKFCL